MSGEGNPRRSLAVSFCPPPSWPATTAPSTTSCRIRPQRHGQRRHALAPLSAFMMTFLASLAGLPFLLPSFLLFASFLLLPSVISLSLFMSPFLYFLFLPLLSFSLFLFLSISLYLYHLSVETKRRRRTRMNTT